VTLPPLTNISPHRRAVHTSRARRQPANRTPEVDHDDRFEMVGRGAGEAHGPQSRTKFTTNTEYRGVDGSYCAGTAALGRGEGAGSEAYDWHHFRIPKGLNERRRGPALLKATTRRPTARRGGSCLVRHRVRQLGGVQAPLRPDGGAPSEEAALRLQPVFFC
jgi:hypothetical protein